jgi:acetoin utilization deacetylase AcuC-like enzyme
MATGLVWHERYMWHDTRAAAGPIPAGGWVEPGEHAENPATKRRLKNLLDVSGLTERLVSIQAREATVEEVCRFHTREYVERIKALSDDNGGEAGGFTPFGPGSYEIALLAAGGVIAAVDAVLDGTVDNAFALVRPPGHHALADEGMGFCIFGNCAIAVHHARQARGVGRVAIVDWDVHHGNGTQAAFYDDGSVLTISIHQDNCFPPGSGTLEENGEGDGLGASLNVPLPPGSGVPAYVQAFERVVVPALDGFRPELVIVASGLDASGMDPLGRQLMHSDGYRELTRLVLGAAERHAGGRLVVAHEGGYSQAVVPFCGLAIVETLSGIRTAVVDPFLGLISAQGGETVLPHQAAAIDAAAALVDRVPALA